MNKLDHTHATVGTIPSKATAFAGTRSCMREGGADSGSETPLRAGSAVVSSA
jgi:hypothetical protein